MALYRNHPAGIGGLPKRFPCGMLPVAAISLHSFSSVPLVIRRGQPKKNLWYLSEVSREAILLCELAVTVFGFFFFLPWTWNWCKLRETRKWNANFRSERSNQVPAYLFRISFFSRNFPLGRTDETFSIYHQTEISGNFD